MSQEIIDKILAIYGSGDYQEEIRAARREYFRLVPDLREDDTSFERMTACFLNWYILDRPLDGKGQTPLQHYAFQHTSPQQQMLELEALSGNVHSLFEVKELEQDGLRVEDMFTGEPIKVNERRALAGLQKYDIMEARLLPVAGKLVFAAGAFVVHPRQVASLVRKSIQEYRRQGEPAADKIIRVLQALAFRYLDRYRQRVSAERLYSEYDRLISA